MRPDLERGGLYLENEAEVAFALSALRSQRSGLVTGGDALEAESSAENFLAQIEIAPGDHDTYLDSYKGEAVLVALGYVSHWEKNELAVKLAPAMKSEYFAPLRRKNRLRRKLVN